MNTPQHPSQATVLLVEDNIDDVLLTRRALRKSGTGAQLRVAQDGGEPADEATAAALLIAVTGWGQEEDRRRTRAVGVDHHLVKPVDPDTLLQAMARGRASRPDGEPQ